MAMIKCPECGKKFSDLASACPNCGCPTYVAKEEQQQEQENHKEEQNYDFSTTESHKDKRTKRPILNWNQKIKIKGFFGKIYEDLVAYRKIIISLVMIVVIIFITSSIALSSRVTSLNIGDWTYQYDDDGDKEWAFGKVTSNRKRPFAVLTTDNTGDYNFVFMKDGKGDIELYNYNDDDDFPPKYFPVGYFTGSTFNALNRNIATYKKMHDVNNYTDEADAEVDYGFDIGSNKNGLLIYDIHNNFTNDTDKNNTVVLMSGSCQKTENIDISPVTLKADVDIIPRYFLAADNTTMYVDNVKVTEDDEEDEDYTTYTGSATVNFSNHENGIALYEEEKISGGDPDEIGEVYYDYVYVSDGKCKLTTSENIGAKKKKKWGKPKWQFRVKGVIPLKTVE